MSFTANTIVYEDDTNRTPDSARYTGPDNSLSTKDLLELKRTAPKPSGDSLGKGRGQLKLTRAATDGSVPINQDAIVTIDSAFPVGMDEVEMTAMITDACTAAISAAGLTVFIDGKITHG